MATDKSGPYPDVRLLKRERKVKDRKAKEQARKSYRLPTKARQIKEAPDISKYENKIICGDSELVLKELPDDCLDIVVTSPPYNFGLDYEEDETDDAVRWDDYFRKLGRIWAECMRVLKPGGRICVNVQPLFSDYIPTHHIISNQLLALGLLWKAEILWEKHNYNCKYTAWGSWRSPSMPYIKYTWEFVEVFCKESYRKPGSSEAIDITGDEFKEWVYAKWEIAPESRMKSYGHPAMFPEELVRRLLKLFSYQGDIVLDPFNGVGTTSVVALASGRRFIGIDISEKYCEIAHARLEEVQPVLL